MAITYRPKVGEVLECNFGQFKLLNNGDFDKRNIDGRIPPEMIKKRLVVVLNGKVGGCLVVPISSTKDLGSTAQGLHVPLSPDLFRVTDFYDKRERWAKAELVQNVSRDRLYKLIDNGQRFDCYLPRDVVEKVQRAVIKSISALSLIK
jgi:uncharacterized protein YifN (PemK superfamily)